MWSHYYQHNRLPDLNSKDVSSLLSAQRATWCPCERSTRRASGGLSSTEWKLITRPSHRCKDLQEQRQSKHRYGQTKRKMKVMVLSIIFSLNIEYFSDGSSGGVLNPWISVPSCSRLLRYQLRPGGTKTTLNPFKSIWGNAKCRPCWASFFSLPQKSLYHRFLVYDPYDKYFPFAIETFKLPASCACYNGAYIESHWFVLALRPILRHT